MKLIKPSYQIIEPTGYTIDDIYKSIELAGRVSHRSEDRITEDSAKTFVERMMNMKHLSTCEFGTIYLHIDYHNPSFGKIIDKYSSNEYSKCIVFPNEVCISSNYRVLVENNWLNDLKYLCEPTEYHHKRYTVKFICDRAILAEFTRHRKFSFMAESTRYCNYSKGKFNSELTFIIPCWMDIPEGSIDLGNYDKTSARYKDGNIYIIDTKPPYVGVDFIRSLCEAEANYLSIVRNGWKPQEARAVLPNSLKTELVMTGFASDWKYFFELRCDSAAHPQARELAIPLKEEFIKKDYIIE